MHECGVDEPSLLERGIEGIIAVYSTKPSEQEGVRVFWRRRAAWQGEEETLSQVMDNISCKMREIQDALPEHAP